MKNILNTIAKYSLLCGTVLLATSCEFEEVIDQDGPSVDGVSVEASKGQLNELVVGVESTTRNGLGVEVSASGTMARELYLFDADPRNTSDLLGKNGTPLDNNSFYSTSQWGGNYRAIKNANLLIDAVNNTSAVNDAERSGYLGYAKTVIAYELIQVLKAYNKARVDVSDPDNLGPLLDFDPAIAAIRAMLNEANGNLQNAGDSFVFSLSDGFEGYDTPATFSQFNRAAAAVAAVYAGDGAGAITALNASYFDLTGDLTMGPKHTFGLGGNDQANPVFRVPSTDDFPNNGDQIIVHDSWLADAEVGDTRVTSKTAPRPDPTASQDGLTGVNETRLYATNTSEIDMIRNEELILVFAEASILAGALPNAEAALNVIRNQYTIGDFGGATDAASLTTEMLNQRRYSLWSENHRMFDLRRYSLSNTLPIDRAGDQIFNVLPIPLTENL
jgi:hypothetical protein